MAFWNRKPKPDGSDYMYFAQKYLNEAEEIGPQVLQRLRTTGDPLSLSDLRLRMMKIISEMESLPVPAQHRETLNQHKQGYLQLFDIQLRKLEDLMYNGGDGLDEIQAEMVQLLEARQRDAADASSKLSDMRREWGLE